MDSVKYRLLRNQMVIMLALRNIVSNDNIKGLLDDNIEPTADMLQCNELSNYNHYQQGRADQKNEDNEFFNFDEVIRIECDKARADAYDEIVSKMKDRFLHKIGTQFDNAIREMERLSERLKE